MSISGHMSGFRLRQTGNLTTSCSTGDTIAGFSLNPELEPLPCPGSTWKVTTMWLQSFAAHWLRDGWPTRFCSSDRRESANGHLPLDWLSRYFVKRVMNGCSILAGIAPAACKCSPARIPIFCSSPDRRERVLFHWGFSKGDEPDYPVRQSLLCNLVLRSFAGKQKIAVIDDADYLNQEGANCLLKTLEEPPACSVLILVGTSADRQLPTIRLARPVGPISPAGEIAGGKVTGAK